VTSVMPRIGSFSLSIRRTPEYDGEVSRERTRLAWFTIGNPLEDN
jgi:hypothetical protein